MYLLHEEAVKRDIERIRNYLIEMANFAECSLRDSIKACLENDHKLAYAIILRDQLIDEKEKEIDRLCLDFIVRHQPVSEQLRFAFSAIKLNVEIERVGDYAESVARHIFKLQHWSEEHCKSEIVELANTAIDMFHDAISAFIEQSPEKAKETLRIEDKVDSMRDEVLNKLIKSSVGLETPLVLFNIIRRFERVADQARNICMELLYLFTGEYVKHLGSDVIRVLFVDEHNAVLSRIAESIATSLDKPRFIFSSAGIDPKPMDPYAIEFLKKKGYDVTPSVSKSVEQIPNLNFYQVIVALSAGATKLIPQYPRKTIYLNWQIEDPSTKEGNKEKNYEDAYQYIKNQIEELIEAIDISIK
ncbi:MAG: phosphate signaling complex protein PhoU [Chitinispirillaceae bacterium]|nr:phosphate signaling complex protein PhoU [Chitinispirillaceae bacterium]